MSDRFTIAECVPDGLHLLTRHPRSDERGYLERMFCDADLEAILGERRIRQINHTLTRNAGVVRGMHFQNPPDSEAKFITCIRGAVFDVAVDVRKGSPDYLKWFGTVLSADNLRTLFIPEGFAHGFQTLCPDCEMLYYHTHPYVQGSEGALNALDPRIGIVWPQTVTELSQRDQAAPFIDTGFAGVLS